MQDQVTRWAQILPGLDDAANVHPDDRTVWSSVERRGRLLEIVGTAPPYTILAWGDQTFRVKPTGFVEKAIGQAKQIGDIVTVFSKSRNETRSGVIADMMWHGDRGEPFYFLRIDGRRVSKRYWFADFR